MGLIPNILNQNKNEKRRENLGHSKSAWNYSGVTGSVKGSGKEG